MRIRRDFKNDTEKEVGSTYGSNRGRPPLRERLRDIGGEGSSPPNGLSLWCCCIRETVRIKLPVKVFQ